MKKGKLARRPVPVGDTERLVYRGKFVIATVRGSKSCKMQCIFVALSFAK